MKRRVHTDCDEATIPVNMAQQLFRAPNPNPSPNSPSTAPAAARPPDDFSYIIALITLTFLTYNSIAAIRRSIHDPWTVAFLSACYIDSVLLYFCFYFMIRTPASDLRRLRRIKAALWSLILILMVMVSYRVSAFMPLAMAAVIWVLSAVTVAGGFYALFLYKEAPEKEEAAAGKKSSYACEKC